MYVQAISAYARTQLRQGLDGSPPFRRSQLAWMKGYAHGVQQADLEARGVILPM